MRQDKTQALLLRKEGKSYKEIKEQLGIPLATQSNWFKKIEWSNNISKCLSIKNLEISSVRIVRLNKIRGKHLEKLYAEAREEAKQDFVTLRDHPLFIAGVMAYWGEGDKASKNGFRISNSDPLMIKIFVVFLKNICGVTEERVRASLLIYPDLNKEQCENYWSNQIGLARTNFTKSITVPGRHKTRRVQYGICTLNYSSRFLKEKMLVWMSLLAKSLLED